MAFGFAVVWLLIPVFRNSAIRASHAGDLAWVFGSEQAVDTVRNAKRVTAYKLDPRRPHSLPGEGDMFDENLVASGPIEVSPAVVQELQAALLDPAAYDWKGAIGGLWPDYLVRIQFATDQDRVDILFDFRDGVFQTYHNGKAWVSTDRNGYREFAQRDFDYREKRVLGVVKRLFPDDKELQGL
jgi:hypothetical protein